MAKHRANKKGAWFVVISDAGYLELFDNTGKKVPFQIKCRLSDNVDEISKATIKIQVNVAGSEAEMHEIISSYK